MKVSMAQTADERDFNRSIEGKLKCQTCFSSNAMRSLALESFHVVDFRVPFAHSANNIPAFDGDIYGQRSRGCKAALKEDKLARLLLTGLKLSGTISFSLIFHRSCHVHFDGEVVSNTMYFKRISILAVYALKSCYA